MNSVWKESVFKLVFLRKKALWIPAQHTAGASQHVNTYIYFTLMKQFFVSEHDLWYLLVKELHHELDMLIHGRGDGLWLVGEQSKGATRVGNQSPCFHLGPIPDPIYDVLVDLKDRLLSRWIIKLRCRKEGFVTEVQINWFLCNIRDESNRWKNIVGNNLQRVSICYVKIKKNKNWNKRIM